MTDAITDSAGLSGPVKEAPVARKRAAKGTTATKKAAAEAPVAIENVSIEDASTVTNEEGQKVISGPKKPRASRKSNSFVTETGAIGSRAADSALGKKSNTETPKDDSGKVAVWSSKNIRWTGVGDLSKGYNIVTKEAADKWLGINGIRKATPEEVATHYGK